nr:DUF6735 family protein [Halorientalis brevis]
MHYSHWGAHRWQLATAITPTQPYGQPTTPENVTTATVDPTPLATDCSFGEVLESLDFQQYEAFYLVTEAFAVEPWLVCWFGVPGVDENRPGDGGLVAVDPEAPRSDGAALREQIRDAKETVCTLVARDRIDSATARAALASTVQSWGREGRTVRLGPTASTAVE